MNEMTGFVVQCFAVTTSIAFGIVFIYFFIKLFGGIFNKNMKGVKTIGFKDFIKPNAKIELTLNNGKVYSEIKFIGFTDIGHQKGIPFVMMNWVVVESDLGKIFIKPESIKIIKEVN